MATESKSEPVLIASAVYTLFAAVVGIMVAFNVWHPSSAQVQAIATGFTAVTPFLAFFVRSKVTPVKNLPKPVVTEPVPAADLLPETP